MKTKTLHVKARANGGDMAIEINAAISIPKYGKRLYALGPDECDRLKHDLADHLIMVIPKLPYGQWHLSDVRTSV